LRPPTIREALAKRYSTPGRASGDIEFRAYRIICEIQEERVVVLVVGVGHRSKIYD
jgi:hypothetical protein